MVVKKHWINSAHGHFCKSAQCLRSSSRSMQGTDCPKIPELQGNLMQTHIRNQWKSLLDFPLLILTPNAELQEKLAARLLAQIRTTDRRPEVIQTILWRWCEDCRKRTILHHTWYRRRTKWDATLMPRIYDASQWTRDSCKRMDSKQYEDRPSLEHESLLSWWSIQYWNSGPISVSRQNRFLG